MTKIDVKNIKKVLFNNAILLLGFFISILIFYLISILFNWSLEGIGGIKYLSFLLIMLFIVLILYIIHIVNKYQGKYKSLNFVLYLALSFVIIFLYFIFVFVKYNL